MKQPAIIFWILITIGTLALFSSIFAFTSGADFNTYFWGGFGGIVLIGTAVINHKKKRL